MNFIPVPPKRPTPFEEVNSPMPFALQTHQESGWASGKHLRDICVGLFGAENRMDLTLDSRWSWKIRHGHTVIIFRSEDDRALTVLSI